MAKIIVSALPTKREMERHLSSSIVGAGEVAAFGEKQSRVYESLPRKAWHRSPQ